MIQLTGFGAVVVCVTIDSICDVFSRNVSSNKACNLLPHLSVFGALSAVITYIRIFPMLRQMPSISLSLLYSDVNVLYIHRLDRII